MNAENPTTPEVPRSVAGMEWPARCLDCGLLTEDPDAYGGDDGELMPDGTLCCRTGTFHRWAPTTRTPTTPEVALATALHERVCLRIPDYDHHEIGRRTYLCDAAAILAALDDWTLVTVGWRDGMVTLANQYEAEIARLRVALENSAEFGHYFALGVPSTTPQHLPGPFDLCQAGTCKEARAALAPEAE